MALQESRLLSQYSRFGGRVLKTDLATDWLVSVVIPTFNYARFLAPCLESVQSQNYPEMELIIVDDASKDNSAALARELAKRDAFAATFKHRITIQENPENLGAHATINRAISLSHGHLIAILNADDLFGPNRIRGLVAAMKQKAARIAFSSVHFVGEDGSRLLGDQRLAQQLRMRQRAISKFPSTGFACLASNVAISTGNLIFERSLFDEIGPFSDLRYCHDWDFLLRAVLASEPIYVSDVAYHYRVHGANSFRALDGVAMTESATVYRTYFNSLLREKPSNRIAPSPDAWPGVFDAVMSAYGLWQFWSGEQPE